MPQTRCFFCRCTIGKRKTGFLQYEDIYAKDPEHGYIVCIDCFDALEASIRKIRMKARIKRMKLAKEKVIIDIHANQGTNGPLD